MHLRWIVRYAGPKSTAQTSSLVFAFPEELRSGEDPCSSHRENFSKVDLALR